MAIIGIKTVAPTEVHIGFLDGELIAETHLLPHIKTVDLADKYGLPHDKEYHFAIDQKRTLIIHVTEHIFSDMRRTATTQRLRDIATRASKPRRVMIRERKKPSYPRRGPRRGTQRGRTRKRTPQPIDISLFTSSAIIARLSKQEEEEKDADL